MLESKKVSELKGFSVSGTLLTKTVNPNCGLSSLQSLFVPALTSIELN
jgi:hypothetical protein